VNDPVWIEATDVYSFHQEMLARFGGLAGLRDEGLLLSALSRPQHLFHYGKPSLFELAPEEDVVVQTRALAAGDIGAKEYAAWLKSACSTPRS